MFRRKPERQCALDFAQRLVWPTAGDIHRYVGSLERAAKVRDIPVYFSKIETRLAICQTPSYGLRVDVVKRDPLDDVFRPILEQDNGGILRLANNLPVPTHQTARRQGDNTIAAVSPSENMFQGLCGCEAKFVSRQATLSKALDRRVEETLNFNVQVEERTGEEFSQFSAYGALADAADTSEKYAHIATLREE